MFCFICPPLIAGGLLVVYVLAELTIELFVKAASSSDHEKSRMETSRVYSMNANFDEHLEYKKTG